MAVRHDVRATADAPAAPTCTRYSIQPEVRGGSVAVCSCGWRSPGARSAGVAGGLWDAHVAEGGVS